jgi:hypothetical protein
MQAARLIFAAVLLLGLAAGCGGDAAVETPENPAPRPQSDPVPTSHSLPADSAPGK